MKKFVNFRFVVTLVLAIFANVATYAQDNVVDEVVWVVGDEAILKSDVEEARMDALYNGRRFEGDPYCVIPEEIAVQKLFLHQAKLDSIEVSEAEIIQRVDMMTNMYIQQIGSKEKMEEYFNKTSTQIRETLRDNARDGLTVQKMQQKLVGEIKVTPAEVRRYFKDLPQDSIPYIPTQVEVQIITLQPKIPISEIEDVKKKLRDYTDRVTKGEIDFSTLARLYSEDKASAIKGGECGFMGRGMMDPAYANVAFSLQDPKKVSKIVESEFGYHIIQLIEKRGENVGRHCGDPQAQGGPGRGRAPHMRRYGQPVPAAPGLCPRNGAQRRQDADVQPLYTGAFSGDEQPRPPQDHGRGRAHGVHGRR